MVQELVNHEKKSKKKKTIKIDKMTGETRENSVTGILGRKG